MNFVQPIRDKDVLKGIKASLKKGSERNYMLFSVGINTGLRISDLLKLKKKDVFKKKHLIIKEGKTGKKKTFPIHEKLQLELKRYCKDLEDEDYLFPSREGRNKPLTRYMAYRILREAAEEFEVYHIGTHTLRKTFGYHFYKKKKDVAILQKIFNHSDPGITLRYIGIIQDTIDEALDDYFL
ncbi:tyrosine-type recombinase/integrase [Streptomyces fungicidicus]|uniref:tyrosine-type recombinase/integrase n=1 Tax=Streptomyces fungicidicus TaxID=68203 RepID=UPI0033D73669